MSVNKDPDHGSLSSVSSTRGVAEGQQGPVNGGSYNSPHALFEEQKKFRKHKHM